MACVVLAGSNDDKYAQTTKYVNNIDEAGNYNYDFATSNGISAGEQGTGGHYASGGYAYYSPEGELIQTSYTADENGFQPSGSHLPTPPPIPYQILKALEYIRTHPAYYPEH